MNRSIHMNQKRRFVFTFSFAIIMVSLVLFLCSMNLSAKEKTPVYKYYTSVTVESGDTLWDIADDYISEEYADKNDYIKEVKSLNHMTDDRITAGTCIVVPYYSTEYK